MSRLSVVVPVYNVEEYLDWCLDSLANQTFRDIEIICVNDGSTDSSRDKLSKWAEGDSRIKIIDKMNGGLSSARNAGISVASSDYIAFLDSDDRFHLDACETIVRILDETSADVLTFGADCYPVEAGYPWLVDVLSPRDIVYEEFSLDILFKEKSRPFAWRTACRASFLRDNNIKFVDGFGEDQVFDFAIYPRSNKTVFSSSKLYDYRVARKGSLMDLMRFDLAAKMREHVKIVARIFEDWQNGGFLHTYSEDMIAFAIGFALYDALKLKDGEYRAAAEDLRSVFQLYWTKAEVEKMALSPSVRSIALDACYSLEMSSLLRKKLAMDYYIEHYGRKAAMRRLLEKLKVLR